MGFAVWLTSPNGVRDWLVTGSSWYLAEFLYQVEHQMWTSGTSEILRSPDIFRSQYSLLPVGRFRSLSCGRERFRFVWAKLLHGYGFDWTIVACAVSPIGESFPLPVEGLVEGFVLTFGVNLL